MCWPKKLITDGTAVTKQDGNAEAGLVATDSLLVVVAWGLHSQVGR